METTLLWQIILKEPNENGYRFGTERAVAPKETLARILPLMERAGITRLADLTGLDWIGIPVYQAIRPNSRNISVSMGKGLTRTQAKVSALMESLEGFHAEKIALPSRRASVASMRPLLGYDPFRLAVTRSHEHAVLNDDTTYDPFAPPVGHPSDLGDDTPLDWIEATNLETGCRSWLPRKLCELDYRLVERPDWSFFRATSNGLASGNTVVEALCHALLELLERDAILRAKNAVCTPERQIILDTVSDPLCRRVLDRFLAGGLGVTIVDTTSPAGLPCFQVFLAHDEQAIRHYGAGCHPSRATALLRALTEAAQSRLGYIAGSRDDLRMTAYRAPVQARAKAAEPSPRRHFEEAPNLPRRGFTTVLNDLVQRTRSLSGTSPLAVDLRRRTFGYLPIVMVIAPGLRHPAPERQ